MHLEKITTEHELQNPTTIQLLGEEMRVWVAPRDSDLVLHEKKKAPDNTCNQKLVPREAAENNTRRAVPSSFLSCNHQHQHQQQMNTKELSPPPSHPHSATPWEPMSLVSSITPANSPFFSSPLPLFSDIHPPRRRTMAAQ